MVKIQILVLPLVLSCSAHASEPHPQPTYGAIEFTQGYRCRQHWIEDRDGNVYFTYCGDREALYEELGKLDEEDPSYYDKEAILIDLIETSRDG